MRQARSLAERVAIAHPNDARILHYLGFALYAEAGTLPGGSEEARELLQQADSILARSARLRPLAETHALRSSVIGQQIGSSPIRGMRLGPQASREMERALSLGPRNPRVWLLRGISAMHTPQAWGGGLQRAEDYLRRAIALAQVDSARFPDPTWGRGEAHVWLGEVLARRGHDTDARLEYRRALEIEPDNSRARRRLHERDDAGRP
jgi:Flp pilus assembly protein TadD